MYIVSLNSILHSFNTFFINNSLRYKQNKYPVLLLTQGVNTKYDQYLDQRTHNINNGSHFAATADILGINKTLSKIQLGYCLPPQLQ